MPKEHLYVSVDFSLWDVLKFHAKSEKLMKVELLHVFGDKGSRAILVTADDKVYVTGNNFCSCLGIGNQEKRTETELHELIPLRNKKVKCFASGAFFTIALTASGELFSWGDNSFGQLGNGTYEKRCFPGEVTWSSQNSVKIDSIACGYYYSLALTNNNDVYQWGNISLDPAITKDVAIPNIFSKFVDHSICQIACNGYTAAALSRNGIMFVWGQYDSKTYHEPVLIASEVWHIGCSLKSYMYIRHGNLYFNEEAIGEADDFVVQDDYLCYRNGKDFYMKWHHERPELVKVDDFQSAYSNRPCPQFLRAEPVSRTKCFKIKNIKDRNVYRNFFNNKENSDLTIKLSNGNIYVQKSILIGLCDHFKRVLTGPWSTFASTEMDMTTYNPVAYETFLKYVYSGDLICYELKARDLIDLYSIAQSYFENDLRIKIALVFKKCLTTTNLCDLYSLAANVMSIELMQECYDFASEDLSNVILTEGFDQMEPELAKKLVKLSTIRRLQKNTII